MIHVPRDPHWGVTMSHQHGHAGGHGEGGTTGVHGMLLFGEELVGRK
jgi:hypothetical protein